MVKRLILRLSRLDAAVQPGEMNTPGFNLHRLQGSPVRYTVHVNGPWCLTFEWEGEDAIRVDLEHTPESRVALSTTAPGPYISRAGSLAMAINGAWNKRSGPGGSARRLHHLGKSAKHGGDTGSTRAVKMYLSLGMVPPLSGHMTSANDNTEALAVAA